jgi:hypothetical protein
MRALATEMLLP